MTDPSRRPAAAVTRGTVTRRAVLGAGAGLSVAAVLATGPAANAADRAAAGAAGRASGRAAGSAGRGPAARTYPFVDGWRFGPDAAGATDPGYDDGGLAEVCLPHTVVPLSWREWDPATWERVWVYRRPFRLDLPAGTRAFVDVGAALVGATVVVDGTEVGEHVGGYLPFDFEITGALRDGRDHLLAVRLDSRHGQNTPPEHVGKPATAEDYWQAGGLYRDVSVRVVPAVFVADVFARPTKVAAGASALAVEVTVDAAGGTSHRAELEATVRASARNGRPGRILGRAVRPVDLTGGGAVTTTLPLDHLDVELWDLDAPHLYDVAVRLRLDGRAVHDFTRRTGFRDAHWTERGFFLNGRRVQLFGAGRHQHYPFAGSAMPARVQARDADVLRQELNCNFYRSSHYPPGEPFLDRCDEIGLLAWEEAPGWGIGLGDAVWKDRLVRDVHDMIVRDRHHPSIVVWGARVNETEDDTALYTRTQQVAKELDPTRQTSGAMIGGTHDTKNFQQDVFSYNDYLVADGHASLLPPRTDKPYFVSEAVGTLSGPAKYYTRIAPLADQQGQATAHAWVHDIAASDERYCGLASWSGMDYPSGTGNQLDGVKYTGVVDLFRELKPGAALYRSHVDPRVRPVVEPAFYWDFGPKMPAGGPGANAVLCTNCDRVEVYVGGKHLTTARPARDVWAHLPHPPCLVDLTLDADVAARRPELRLDGYVGARRVVSRRFAADPRHDRLVVRADDRRIAADGADATRVVFRVLDRYGAARPYVTGDVRLRLAGPAVLVGDEDFAFEAAGGVGAAWVRSRPGRRGLAVLAVTHEHYGTATARVLLG